MGHRNTQDRTVTCDLSSRTSLEVVVIKRELDEGVAPTDDFPKSRQEVLKHAKKGRRDFSI